MNEWKEFELQEISDVRDGTHESPKYKDKGYPLITSKNLRDGYINFTGSNLISKEDFDNINKRSKVEIGDILMPMIGTVGNPVVVSEAREFAIKNVALIKQSNKDVSNRYIKLFLESEYFNELVKSVLRGGTQKFISLRNIRELIIPIPVLADGTPDLKKQEEVVLILEKAESLKKKRGEAAEILDEYIQAVFYDMFLKNEESSKKINGEDYFELAYGKSLPSSKRTGEGNPVYGSNGIVGYHSDYLVKGPGIIIGRKGSMGEVNFAKKDFFPIDTTYYIVPKIKSNWNFLYYLLRNTPLKHLNKAAAVPGLNRNDVYSMDFIAPDINLQNKFSEILEYVENQKKIIESSSKDSEDLFDSLSQKAFAGELIK